MKAAAQIEISRWWRYGVDEKSPNADRFRGVPRPEKRVAQQQATKSHVLVTVIDGKTSQYGRRNRTGMLRLMRPGASAIPIAPAARLQ
jgi:hypothetical protein